MAKLLSINAMDPQQGGARYNEAAVFDHKRPY